MTGDVVLRTEGLHKHFGGLRALDGVDVEVHDGEILSVIGPNGAGKTTLFNLITGVHRPTRGRAELRGEDGWHVLTGRRPSEVARLGVVRTFQNVRPFEGLTVRQNVLAGLGHDRYRSLDMFGRYTTADHRERADDLLERVGIREYADADGAALPLALQRRLEVARALALSPRVLLLDEPAAGLNEGESEELMALFRDIVEEGLTIVFIEHAMDVVMNVSDRIYVLDQGSVIAEGVPDDIREDERVAEAYFGAGAAVEPGAGPARGTAGETPASDGATPEGTDGGRDA